MTVRISLLSARRPALTPPPLHCTEPADPPVIWVHPCNCTLVAHETCLLNWIKAAQSDASRSNNALKCPQCSAQYEIVSERPWGLRMLDHLSESLSVAGKVVTASTITAVVLACGAGAWLRCGWLRSGADD